MKKSILLFGCLCLSSLSFGQVSFTILEPASIAGGYNFTSNGDGTNWGLPNLNNPLDAIEDTVMLVDDGTPGINAQGIPFANEGCGPLINDLTGKIAFVYRYDGVSANVCFYGTKVLMAEQAGAIGVIMVNREDALIDVPGTTDGPATTIPFAFISKADGEIIRAKLDAGEDVIAFLGNKLGLYSNDVGIKGDLTVPPKIAAMPAQTAQNASEFGFDVGTKVFNFGTSSQSNVSVTATVSGPAGTWSETSGPYSLNSGDSIDVFTGNLNNLPAYSQASYPDGRYTLTYQIDLGIPDESDFDNSLSFDFVISDSLVGYCRVDPITNLPVPNVFFRPNASNSHEMCIVFENPNASRLAVAGVYFSSLTGFDSGVDLTGEEILVNCYEWNDVFADINDAAMAFNDLNPVAFGNYYYPSDLQDQTVYGAFSIPIQLNDNQRYLACVQSSNVDLFFGYDGSTEYIRSIDFTLEPISPVFTDAGQFALGFGTDKVPAMALKVFDASELEVAEFESEFGVIYPNPAVDDLNIKLNQDYGTGVVSIVDLTGREVLSGTISMLVTQLDMSELASGHYQISIKFDSGLKAQFMCAKQ